MAAAFLTQTVDAKLSLANKLARAEALVRDNVQRSPVSYQADAVAALQAAQAALTTALTGA